MKKFSFAKLALASICALGLTAALSVRADTIATWSFEAGQNSGASSATVNGATIGSIASDVGTGFASGVHVSTSTAWSFPAGDANAAYPSSVHSLSANNWAQNDYFQFTANLSLGSYTYSGIGLSWDQTGSNTGPAKFGLWYSTDGSGFTQFGSGYTLSFFSWNTTTVAGNHESADLSAITGLNTASTIYFRIIENSDPTTGSIVGAAIGTAGTDRIDNFTITANVAAIPEPSSLCLLGGFGLLVWHMIRRRK